MSEDLISRQTINEAIEVLDDMSVCKDCECWREGYWGGCYRTSSTGKMLCDKKEDALDVLRKAVEERTAKVTRLNMVTENNRVYKCENCGQYMHRTAWSNPVKYCSSCGARLEWK